MVLATNKGKTSYRFDPSTKRRARFKSSSLSQHPRLLKLQQHSTPVIHNPQALLKVIQRRFTYAGISRSMFQNILCVGARQLYAILSGHNKNYSTGTVQAINDFLGIRYQKLPYTKTILEESEDILSAIEERAQSLDVDLESSEFEYVFGISYNQLRIMVLNKSRSKNLYDILTQNFKIRLWPKVKRYKSLHTENFDNFVKELKTWMKSLDITSQIIADNLGITRALFRRFIQNPEISHQLAPLLAKKFGYKIEPLPFPQRVFLNADFVEAVLHQCQQIGWSLTHLAQTIGLQYASYITDMFKALKTPTTQRKNTAYSCQDTINQVALVLKIETHTLDTLPSRKLPCYKSVDELVALLGPVLRNLRCDLGLSTTQVVEDLENKFGIKFGTDSLTIIDRGDLGIRNRLLFEHLLNLFHYQFDPFTNTPLVKLPQAKYSGPKIQKYIATAIAQSLISYERLVSILGITKRERSNIMSGQRNTTHESTLGLCRLLNIALKGDHHFESFLKIENLLKQHKISIQELCQALDIDEDDYYKFKAGIYTFDSELAKKITLFLHSLNWEDIVRIKINKSSNLKAIADELNFNKTSLQDAIEGKVALFSDEVLELAIHLGIFDEMIVQHLTEMYENDPQALKELNMPHYSNTLANPHQVRLHLQDRMTLLFKQHKGQDLTRSELDLLNRTGGQIDDLAELSLNAIFYRYSIGDTMAACLAWRLKDKRPEDFEKLYNNWLKRNYDLKVTVKYEIQNIPGKTVPVAVEIQSFEIMMRKLMKEDENQLFTTAR